MLKRFFVALSFFTRVPIVIKSEVSEDTFFKSMLLMPLIGLGIGALLWALSFALAGVGAGPAAFLTLLAYLIVTGGLHFDGVADTADAALSARDREKMMQIMKDSRLGTFGALALIVFALALFTAFSELYRTCLTALLILAPAVGRCSAVQLGAFSKPAPGGGGLGRGFCGVDRPWISVLCTAAFAGAALLYMPLCGLRAFYAYIAAMALSLIQIRYFARTFGGITGDQIGFAIESGQILFLYAFLLLKI